MFPVKETVEIIKSQYKQKNKTGEEVFQPVFFFVPIDLIKLSDHE